jgi:hypothetical protein
VPDDGMPADPFREGQVDWGWLAGNDAGFFAAHAAAGMAENVALELTRTYLQFLLGVMLAGSAQQHPEQHQGEAEPS